MPEQTIAIIVVVAFIALVVLLTIADKNASKKFTARFLKEHQVKESYGDCFISKEGEFVLELPSGTVAGYKVWKLKDVHFVAVHKNQFSLLDAEQKAMVGEYHTPSKKPLKEKKYKTFGVKVGQSADDVAALIIKNGDHIKKVQGGKVV
jgi:hypothetical protein